MSGASWGAHPTWLFNSSADMYGDTDDGVDLVRVEEKKEITWETALDMPSSYQLGYIDLTDRFGVENYPFGPDATLSLLCAKRGDISEEPQVEIQSDKPVTIEIFWDSGSQSKTITAGGK